MSLNICARGYLNTFMTIISFLFVDGTNLFTSLQWTKRLQPYNIGPLDYQPRLSLEGCSSLCWEEQECKSVNYHRHAALCELHRTDSSDPTTELKDDPESIYSEKSSWTEEEMRSMCLKRKRPFEATNECTKDSKSSYCPEPEFVADTEVILGNLRRIDNKIRYACIISNPSQLPAIFPVDVSRCQNTKEWSQSWRPCTEPGKNYALNKPAFQSTTFVNDHGQSEAFYAVDGAKTDDTSTPHFTCAHTIDRHGWWYVDLEEEVVVGYIVVYIRTDETNYVRFQRMMFTVAKTQEEIDQNIGSFCGFFEGPIADPNTENPVTIRCRIPQVGRFIRVSATDGTIEMCELEVYTILGGN